MIVIHKFISKGNTPPIVGRKSSRAPAIGRAIAHVKYIQHRPGRDKDDDGREFFDENGKAVNSKEIRQLIKKMDEDGVVLHKLMLSPDFNLADKKQFTLDVMKGLGSDKGLKLRWFAVEHNNTDNYHVHVIVLGKDKSGRKVWLDKDDYKSMREKGEDYLMCHHPISLTKAREEQAIKKEEKKKESERLRALNLEERIRDGLELPWLHKMIVREQLEPYSQWKKQLAGRPDSVDPKDAGYNARNTIEAIGKKWTKDNTLEELEALDKHLWKNFHDRIDHAEYCKLVAWIKEKERLEKNEERQNQADDKDKSKDKSKDENKDKKPASSDQDDESFTYQGTKYSEKSTYEDLKGLSSKLREKGAEKLSRENYRSFYLWMEDADRARFSGILHKQMELAKKQHDKKVESYSNPNNFKAPGGPSSGAATMFGAISFVGKLAYGLVSIFDFSMGQDTSEDMDRKRTETIFQPDMHRQIKGP